MAYRNHMRRSCASPVLTAIGLINGKPWEPLNFNPPQNRHTLTDRYKNLSQVIRSTTSTAVQNLVEIPPSIYAPFLSNSPTGQTAHHIFTLNGLNDADLRKGVPFLFWLILQPI